VIKRIKIFSLLFFLTTRLTIGQTTTCETIHKVVGTNPTYTKGTNDLFNYFNKELAPIVYSSQNKELTTKLVIALTINADGKVIDAVFSKNYLTAECTTKLRTKLLTMTGWTSGRLNGKNVCSTYSWMITCFKWG
jgi:hypothetical protein